MSARRRFHGSQLKQLLLRTRDGCSYGDNDMGKMLSLSLALGTAVIASASVAHAEATKRPPTNELVGFIGLGGPGPGGIPPPQVSISAGKAGVISIVTGYLGGSSESLAYLEFIPTRFRGLSAPVCLFQPNAFPDSGSGTPRTPGAFILSSAVFPR